MRRLHLAPLALLLALPLGCRAADSDDAPAPRKGACVYVRPAANASIAAEDQAPQARPAVPSAARATPRASAPAAGGGGGGDSDPMPVRNRGTRWHSFLPGMFR
jgi:hypothetical protein